VKLVLAVHERDGFEVGVVARRKKARLYYDTLPRRIPAAAAREIFNLFYGALGGDPRIAATRKYRALQAYAESKDYFIPVIGFSGRAYIAVDETYGFVAGPKEAVGGAAPRLVKILRKYLAV